ncbi:MAG: Ig-like domain-containing protein [Gammaproteobacteria bacterium]
MKFSWRAVLCAVVMIGATGAFKACSSGPSSGGEDPPKTVDDRLEVTATGTASLGVLTNDTNLTHEPLTYTIDESPSVGSAAFNDDHTVRLTLPSGFKGLTKFKYKITNSVGGFSISSAAVFVDVPAYRALFAAKGTAGTYELYVSDFISSTKISNAVTGNVRLQNAWRSKTGLLVAYERADPAQLASTTELFFVKTASNASPVKFGAVLGRAVISGAPVAISDDSRWIAYPTNPTSASGQATNLYVLDSNSSGSPTAVGSSAGTFTALTQWIGTDPALYFMAAPGNINGHAVFRAGVSGLDAPERISPVYPATDQQSQLFVSPDQTRVLIVGTHGGQNGAFFIDPSSPNVERRLTTDMPAGAVIEAFRTDDAVSRLTYLWRIGNSLTARLSFVDIGTNNTPQTVFGGDVVGLSDLRPDGVAALITRGPSGSGTDGTLYEVTLDRSTADVQIASNVTGGVYAGTGDRVYLYSRTLTPSVIQRSDFERTPSALVRSNTPATALFVSPIFQPSAAILEDPTSGVVLVNAAAPGKTLKFTDLQIGSVPTTTLYPTLIGAAQ